MGRIDLQETRRKALLANAVYDKVTDYALPSDFKAPVDLNTQALTNVDNSSLSRTFSRQFQNQKKNNQFAIIWQDMVQFMRFARYIKAPVTIDKCDSLTEGGTVAVGGNASALVLDTLNYISGGGSYKATVSSPGAIASVTMRLGSSAAAYYEKAITTGHFEAFMTGWNLCRFDLAGLTPVGSVSMSSIKYYRFLVTYNSGQTAYFEKTLTTGIELTASDTQDYLSDGAIFAYLNFSTVDSLSTLRLDSITAGIGTLFDVDYYSTNLFRTAAGVWIQQPTLDSDLINCSTVSFKIFEAEMSRIITQQVQGAMGAFDFAYWNLQLEGDDTHEGLYDKYMNDYPSERIEAQTDYYNFSDDFGLDSGECEDDDRDFHIRS